MVSNCCLLVFLLFFFKQKTAYEMRISDWSSDVCSSDLGAFSLNLLYDRAIAAGRLRGLVHQGDWMDVGTHDGLAIAEAMLTGPDNAEPGSAGPGKDACSGRPRRLQYCPCPAFPLPARRRISGPLGRRSAPRQPIGQAPGRDRGCE